MKTWIDLTDRVPMKFDVERMTQEIRQFESSGWLEHYDPGLSSGWRAILLKSRGGDISGPEAQRPDWDFSKYQRTPHVDKLPYFREIMDFFKCSQGRVRILKLQPGAGIGVHRDVRAEVGCVAFGQVRLHIPIITNDKVIFHVDGERLHMKPGRLYYVDFSKKHFVRNDGTEARLHLVMDLKVDDWLGSFFPPLTPAEKLQAAWMRMTYPAFWKMRWWWISTGILFWKTYNGSAVQRLVHRIKGRGPLPAA